MVEWNATDTHISLADRRHLTDFIQRKRAKQSRTLIHATFMHTFLKCQSNRNQQSEEGLRFVIGADGFFCFIPRYKLIRLLLSAVLSAVALLTRYLPPPLYAF